VLVVDTGENACDAEGADEGILDAFQALLEPRAVLWIGKGKESAEVILSPRRTDGIEPILVLQCQATDGIWERKRIVTAKIGAPLELVILVVAKQQPIPFAQPVILEVETPGRQVVGKFGSTFWPPTKTRPSFCTTTAFKKTSELSPET
jgi:hypothetical protein